MRTVQSVSLFTREWIEITSVKFLSSCNKVSLFTREWIEMHLWRCGCHHNPAVSLFTREWIEMVSLCLFILLLPVSLFTREWIEITLRQFFPMVGAVSLFTREWIEIQNRSEKRLICCVSLFTREWIEIACSVRSSNWSNSLPLYEGVDWNCAASQVALVVKLSPSLRGSGLK